MIVVSFTQPGRGPVYFQATGDPECVGLTPDTLVDTEGPSDSTEACGTHMAWTEEDLGASIQEGYLAGVAVG